MTVYVDWIVDNGWRLGPNCHMFTDNLKDLTELHKMAVKIGLKYSWFQNKAHQMPHYDLTENRRRLAVAAGAVEVNTREQWLDIVRPIKRYWQDKFVLP
jgi:hypothetical protein